MTASKKPVRVLDADTYDTLELGAWCKALNVVRGPHPEPTLYVEAV